MLHYCHKQTRLRCTGANYRSLGYAGRVRRLSVVKAAVSTDPRTYKVQTGCTQHVHLYYRTGWGSAVLHGSVQGSSWQDYPLQKVTSAPGRWLSAKIPLNGREQQPVMEFVVTDRQGNWDKPPAGGNYNIDAPGSYVLRGGSLSPVSGQPVMIVSDLDGTMVGDDHATGTFKKWWEDTAVVRGGVLVYNTGRSLDSFRSLQQEKAHCLAHPDVLISAVGTKIYTHNGGNWHEDSGWVALLDDAWDVAVARDAAYSALAKVGKDSMHFRPPEEQNDHKVTCGVATGVLAKVLDHLEGHLAKGSVTANVIVSGKGDWRFVDVVPQKAGKLEALEYVRQLYSFPVASTVACGDSGNDILMLSGQNPAVVVGNAQPDLLQWVNQRWQDEAGAAERLLLTGAHEALGILEGLQKLGLK